MFGRTRKAVRAQCESFAVPFALREFIASLVARTGLRGTEQLDIAAELAVYLGLATALPSCREVADRLDAYYDSAIAVANDTAREEFDARMGAYREARGFRGIDGEVHCSSGRTIPGRMIPAMKRNAGCSPGSTTLCTGGFAGFGCIRRASWS